MGRKYIIDLNPDCVDGEYLRIPARIAGEEQWLVTKAALTPYTEPDMEKVREEAYEEGYAEGSKEDYDEAYLKGYNQGLEDAWDAARKIIHMPEGDMLNIFTECYSAVCTSVQVFLKYDAAEAIEKIRQYEHEKEEIKVGNEVKSGDEKYIVLQKYFNNIDELMVVLFNRRNGEIDKRHLYNGNEAIFEKTGRHFPEIAEVLQKMKENNDKK